MNPRKILLLCAALALCLGALAEPNAIDVAADMSSDEIYRLEQRLSALGYLNGEADSAYDADTRSALESFQQANGLDVTGVADATTIERLEGGQALSRQDYLTGFANAYAQMAPLAKGSDANDVTVLQRMQRKLKDYGYYSGEPDGIFSDATRQAVEGFQMVNGLPITGVADGAMLMRLMADSPITWPAFLSEMSAAEGDSGLNVYVLQKRLAQMGYFAGSCSASYGQLTREAVEAFQRDAGLEATGQADAATWAAIYSRATMPGGQADALEMGDYGDRVLAVQKRLNALGFFDHDITGEFGFTTETAVRLFQMAVGLTPTGTLDAEAQSRLMADSAASMLDGVVQQRFTQILDSADEATQDRIAQTARSMLGANFGTADDELYPGFAFVQYVCVAAGLPVTFPEDLIRMADRQVETISAVEAGDIVAFQSASADAVTMLLAIGAGNGAVVGTTESGGWAELSYMDRMEGATIYCWDAG